eukprot:463885-Amphidinium_carterae.1
MLLPEGYGLARSGIGCCASSVAFLCNYCGRRSRFQRGFIDCPCSGFKETSIGNRGSTEAPLPNPK